MRTGRSLAPFAFGLVLAAAIGCVRAEVRPTRAASADLDSNVLTAAEIARTDAQDALRAVELARPRWLIARARGLGRAGEQIQIYVESNRYGELKVLKQLSASAIQGMQFLDGRQATTRFGSGHGAGAILVRIVR